jgi:hypothetical protein
MSVSLNGGTDFGQGSPSYKMALRFSSHVGNTSPFRQTIGLQFAASTDAGMKTPSKTADPMENALRIALHYPFFTLNSQFIMVTLHPMPSSVRCNCLCRGSRIDPRNVT